MKIFEYITNHKKNILLVSISLFVVLLVIYLKINIARQQQVPVTLAPTSSPKPPAPEAKGEWGDAKSIISKFGEPISGSSQGSENGLYQYKSHDINKTHKVVYENNLPVLIKETVTSLDNKSAQSIIQKFGQEEIVLYGELSDIGINLYAYPSKGIAYVGNKKDGTLFEVWYFGSTSKEAFMKTWGEEYGTTAKESGF